MSLLSAKAAPRRALILAGGGMRVAYQAGVLRALQEEGLNFGLADGTSGGTMNLGMLLSGQDPVEMCERWSSLRVKDFVSLLPLIKYIDAPHLMAMGDARGLIEKVFPHLGINPQALAAAVDVQGVFNLCNFTHKTLVSVPHQEMDLNLLVAGVSLPVFMPPVQRGGELWCDAVWMKDANLLEAVRRGAEELWLVWCIGNSPKYQPGIFKQYVHMIELSANGGLFAEFEHISEWNQRIAAGEPLFGQTRPIRLHVIRPSVPLPLDSDYYLGRIDAATLIAMGYADARSYLAGRSESGVPFAPHVTAMSDGKPGISFRETMSGGFALGASEPKLGAKQGAKTPLAMRVSVSIDDIDRFVGDEKHAGALHGTLDFPPFGDGIPAHIGVFNLFCDTEQPELKLMVYELGFRHAGEDYYLAGRKELRDDPGFDLWQDTTTLFTRLHRGRDASAPVVGAGILRLGVIELSRLVASMRATNSASLTESARVISKFGSFFLGELWERYGPKA